VLTALETRSMVQVLASPRVTTLNNVPASIEIKDEIPWQQAQTNNNTTSFNIRFEDVGVRIGVTPIITPNDFVRLNIDLSQRIDRGRVGTEELSPLRVSTRTASSSVIVPNRNTVVIGGLRQLGAREVTRAVPWVNRIPIFGWLFKNRRNDADRTNLVLMITPEIVEEATPTDVEQQLYNRLDDQWDMPDYFLDDMSNMTKRGHHH
jgi:type II secretory pathway component GspD/PulD (secretin)